jgi:hypothetical protein
MLGLCRSILSMTLLLPLAGVAAANERPERPAEISQKSVSGLIADLDSGDFQTRTQAMQKLAAAGVPAIEPLLKAAEGDSLEAAVRAVSILSDIYVNVDDDAVETAEQALEQLAASTNRSVAGRADRALNSHYSIRKKRAVAHIERLGGHVEFKSTTDIRVAHSTETEIQWVALLDRWKGGDEGLKHVRRLSELRILYVIKGSEVSQEALDELKREFPQLDIQPRPRAHLGISGSGLDGNGGIQVASVREGSAAHKAGIQPNDVITKFDGEALTSFPALIELLESKDAGEKVEAELHRDGRRLTIEIEMGGWMAGGASPAVQPRPENKPRPQSSP